jgi:hypothetical protein
MLLAGLMMLGVAGGSLAPALAGHASADVRCVRDPDGNHVCWHVSE